MIIEPATGASPVVNASGNQFGFNLGTVNYMEFKGFTVHSALSDNIYLQGSSNKVVFNKCYDAGNSGIKVETGQIMKFQITCSIQMINMAYI